VGKRLVRRLTTPSTIMRPPSGPPPSAAARRAYILGIFVSAGGASRVKSRGSSRRSHKLSSRRTASVRCRESKTAVGEGERRFIQVSRGIDARTPPNRAPWTGDRSSATTLFGSTLAHRAGRTPPRCLSLTPHDCLLQFLLPSSSCLPPPPYLNLSCRRFLYTLHLSHQSPLSHPPPYQIVCSCPSTAMASAHSQSADLFAFLSALNGLRYRHRDLHQPHAHPLARRVQQATFARCRGSDRSTARLSLVLA